MSRKLPSRRLFLRTSLYIGVAIASFVSIGVISVLLVAAAELRGYIETRAGTLGEQAAAVLADGGSEALRNWLLNEADIPAGVSIYVLDDASRDLLGKQLPEQYSDFVRDSVIGKPAGVDSNYLPVRLAPQLIAPDGQRFAFLVLPKGISLWGSPATIVSLIIVALLVISIVAWLIARTLSNPISELQLAVGELAVGHTDARVPQTISSRPDELGALAADFNSMADQLAELITGREALIREMSHELRSPLARLQAAIALAAEKGTLPAGEHDRLEQEIARMNRVIGEMLRYSSMDTSIVPRQRLVRIGKLLDELVQDENIEAQTHQCKLRLDKQPNLSVLGDPELLRSCFENILRNAIRYAPAESSIDISATRNDDPEGTIIVEISDRGPGVTTEQLERIFEPWYRVARGAHHQDSTGLGLAIVRRVAEHHGGSVFAEQRAGGGLTMRVSLPAADLN